VWLESYLGPLRHPSQPILNGVERDTVPASADLRREHRSVVSIVEQHPRDKLGTIVGGEMLDRYLYGSNVARLVVRTLELRWPRHRSNNRWEYPRDALTISVPSQRRGAPIGDVTGPFASELHGENLW
jgi:hypothetical protein